MKSKEKLLKSIGNITRVKILACLGNSAKNVSELIKNCELSQSAVSQHLSYLKNEGVICAEREGRFQYYKVCDKRISKLCNEILKLNNS